MTKGVWMFSVLALGWSCARGDVREASDGGVVPSPPSAPARISLGSVMVQVARRFELAGKAAVSRRYELAAFEAGEIEELFESDVVDAEPPKEGPTSHIPAMAKAFLTSNAHELRRTAAASDAKAFAAAFERAAVACNGCHAASAKAFIQIPTTPGAAVPEIDPLPASSVGPAPLALPR